MSEVDETINKFSIRLTPKEQKDYEKGIKKIHKEWEKKRYEIRYQNWILQRGKKNHSKKLFTALMDILDKENKAIASMVIEGREDEVEEWKKSEKAKRFEKWKIKREKEGKDINSDEAKKRFEEFEYIRENLLEELRSVSDSKIIEDNTVNVKSSFIDDLQL